MNSYKELQLFIKSRYPVVYCETVDEGHTLGQIKAIAREMGMPLFLWSLSEGLRRQGRDGSYYQSRDPSKMLQTLLSLLGSDVEGITTAVFVLKDFEKSLGNALTHRLFKDAINRVRGTSSCFVILSSEYSLPKDIQPDAVQLMAGYPDRGEIEEIVKKTVSELVRIGRCRNLEPDGGALPRIIDSLKGLSVQQIRNIVHQCVTDDGALDAADIRSIEAFKKRVFDQEGLLELYLSERTDSVAGFTNLTSWISERAGTFATEAGKGLPAPKGVLLLGVQGCGKSLAAKVIAGAMGLPLYRLDLARLYSKYIGETEQNVRRALQVVDKLSPLCLWIDEIEKGLATSGSDVDGGVSQRILGSFLTWMQERREGCFIVATANDVSRLPPELLRKGRFDEIFFVDLPVDEDRRSIFRIQLRKRGLDPGGFDLGRMAEESRGFSGAEIEQAVISAVYRASSLGSPVDTEAVCQQLRSTRPLSVLKGEDVEALRVWARDRTVAA